MFPVRLQQLNLVKFAVEKQRPSTVSTVAEVTVTSISANDLNCTVSTANVTSVQNVPSHTLSTGVKI